MRHRDGGQTLRSVGFRRATGLATLASLFWTASAAWGLPPDARSGRAATTPNAKRSLHLSGKKLGTCPGSGELAFAETALTEEFSQLQQSVAALSGGGFGVVWVEGLWPDRKVRMQWLNRHGHPLLPPGGRLLGAGSVDYGDEVIVADATAGAYVAFVAGREVIVQRFDANGEPLWPGEGIVASDVTPSQATFTPHLIPNPGGGVFACFHFSDVGPIRDIRCQRFDAAGTRLWSSTGVSVGTGTDSELRVVPRGLSDGAGGLMLFWRNQRDPFAPQDPGPVLMEGQRFAPDGQKLWGATPKVVRTTNLASSNGYTYNFFQVVSDGSGGAVLAFNDWTGTSNPALDVMAQRVSAAGDLLWGGGAVVTGANGHQQHDQTIATRDGGAFVVVYAEITPSQNRLLLFRLGPNGEHAWAPQGLEVPDPGATALDYAAFGTFDDGVLRLGWTHQKVQFTFEMDVGLVTYASDGTRTGSTFLTTAGDGQFLRGLAWSLEISGLLAVWDDRRKGTFNDLDARGAFLREPPACGSGLFYTVTPCRLLDTRVAGNSPLVSFQPADVVASGACGIPAFASAVALNVTVVSPTALGHLTLYSAGQPRPLASALNFGMGQTRANNATLELSPGGVFTVFPFLADGGSTHLVVDVTGYFQ